MCYNTNVEPGIFNANKHLVKCKSRGPQRLHRVKIHNIICTYILQFSDSVFCCCGGGRKRGKRTTATTKVPLSLQYMP